MEKISRAVLMKKMSKKYSLLKNKTTLYIEGSIKKKTITSMCNIYLGQPVY